VLATELGVSRVTIRQALGAAVDAGLVVRIPGKGTYVSEGPHVARSHGFIGHVVPHLSHTFNVQILLGVESTLKAEGYQLIFCNSEGEYATERRLLQLLETEGMAGCILEPVYRDSADRIIQDWASKHYPVVMLDRYIDGVDADLVASDHFRGGYAVARHLIDQGYTNILYVAREPVELSSIVERRRGYRAAMGDAGLIPRRPFVIEGTTEGSLIQNLGSFTEHETRAIEALMRLLDGPERPEAIVAMNDLLALLVMEAAKRADLQIPHDLALVGFDDMDFAATCQPPLTTVAQQSFRLGVEAAALLLARIRGEDGAVRQVRLPAALVVRNSSLNPRRASDHALVS
jgi:DNA-binding LacI/PurR family transcriptional regulator